MDPGRWKRIEELFHEARSLPAERRAAFLAEACASDTRLLRHVNTLLAADARDSMPGGVVGADADALASTMFAVPRSKPPERLGPYEIRGELGRGGMGVVYLAHDARLEREVAIKVLPPELAGDAERLARFTREARLLASLNDPNIATVFGFEEAEGGARFLVMERLAGETLARRLRGGALGPAVAMSVCAQIASALELAHARGVAHRDLKPGNVMVDTRNRVKVLDFGLARQLTRALPGAAGEGEPPSVAIAGTPGYMSPEQILGQPQDARVDVFAFGCVLYECLTGAAAFSGPTSEMLVGTLNSEVDLSKLPADVPDAVRDLVGRCLVKRQEERLADIAEARRVLEGERPVRPSAAPPTEAPTNLPHETTSFIGREDEIADIIARFESSRLVTLTGAGGSGKTRLGRRVARRMAGEMPGGVWWVDLSLLREADGLALHVLGALGAGEDPDATPEDQLADRLSKASSLLLVDNCEHVVEAAADLLAKLLPACPDLRVIATSREALAVPGEQVVAVGPLGLPEDANPGLEDVERGEAIRLFIDRAVLAAPDFELSEANAPLVLEICRRLDGIPLAIELAAARLRVLSLEQVRARLQDRFRLLVGGSRTALPRHQTLQATIRWSWEHLLPPEAELARRLGVFAAGWTLEDAEAVCAEREDAFEVIDLLTRLVDKSLVVVERIQGEASRYRYLESVRQFMLERLDDAGEAVAIRERHARHLAALAMEAEEHLKGAGQASWVERLGRAHADIVAAIEWLESSPEDLRDALVMVRALWRFWAFRGMLSEGTRIILELVDRVPEGRLRGELADALYGAGALTYFHRRLDDSLRIQQRSLDIAREIGDQRRAGSGLVGVANVPGERGDTAGARDRYAESLALFRRAGDRHNEGIALHNLADSHEKLGDLAAAEQVFTEALDLFHERGNRAESAGVLMRLAPLQLARGAIEEARASLLQAAPTTVEVLANSHHVVAFCEALEQIAESVKEWDRALRIVCFIDAHRRRLTVPSTQEEERTRREALARIELALDAPRRREIESEPPPTVEAFFADAAAWLENLEPRNGV